MGAALILYAPGVPEQTVMEDYLASNGYLAGKYSRYAERFPATERNARSKTELPLRRYRQHQDGPTAPSRPTCARSSVRTSGSSGNSISIEVSSAGPKRPGNGTADCRRQPVGLRPAPPSANRFVDKKCR